MCSIIIIDGIDEKLKHIGLMLLIAGGKFVYG
jgi:hypothetical protein